jgi:hypothetical protein
MRKVISGSIDRVVALSFPLVCKTVKVGKKPLAIARNVNPATSLMPCLRALAPGFSGPLSVMSTYTFFRIGIHQQLSHRSISMAGAFKEIFAAGGMREIYAGAWPMARNSFVQRFAQMNTFYCTHNLLNRAYPEKPGINLLLAAAAAGIADSITMGAEGFSIARQAKIGIPQSAALKFYARSVMLIMPRDILASIAAISVGQRCDNPYAKMLSISGAFLALQPILTPVDRVKTELIRAYASAAEQGARLTLPEAWKSITAIHNSNRPKQTIGYSFRASVKEASGTGPLKRIARFGSSITREALSTRAWGLYKSVGARSVAVAARNGISLGLSLYVFNRLKDGR